MTLLIFAAAIALSGSPLDAAAPSPILKDLPSAPIHQPLDRPTPKGILKDLPSAPARNPLAPPAASPILKIQQTPAAPAPKVIWQIAPMGPLGLFSSKPLVDANGNLVTCNRSTTQALGPNGAPVMKLGDLPPGVEEHAVLRIVNGCPVREIVRDGQTYYLDAPTGGLERDLRAARIARRNDHGY